MAAPGLLVILLEYLKGPNPGLSLPLGVAQGAVLLGSAVYFFRFRRRVRDWLTFPQPTSEMTYSTQAYPVLGALLLAAAALPLVYLAIPLFSPDASWRARFLLLIPVFFYLLGIWFGAGLLLGTRYIVTQEGIWVARYPSRLGPIPLPLDQVGPFEARGHFTFVHRNRLIPLLWAYVPDPQALMRAIGTIAPSTGRPILSPRPEVPEGALVHLRRGIFGASLVAALSLWGETSNALAPPPPSAGVALVDMPAPQLATTGGFLILPLLTLVFLALGARGIFRSRARLPPGAREDVQAAPLWLLALGATVALLVFVLAPMGFVADYFHYPAPLVLLPAALQELALYALVAFLVLFVGQSTWAFLEGRARARAVGMVGAGVAAIAITALVNLYFFIASRGGDMAPGTTVEPWVPIPATTLSLAALVVLYWSLRHCHPTELPPAEAQGSPL